MSKLREVLHAVDPALKVVSGRRPSRKQQERDWVASGGATCPRCDQEAVRFRPEDGVCIACARVLNEKDDRKKKADARFQKFRKKHNARNDKGKTRAA